MRQQPWPETLSNLFDACGSVPMMRPATHTHPTYTHKHTSISTTGGTHKQGNVIRVASAPVAALQIAFAS